MDVNELLKSIDIVDLVSHYVDLEEKNGEYWGLSPFKDEKHRHFSSTRNRQILLFCKWYWRNGYHISKVFL